MNLSDLTEDLIREYAEPDVYQRGRDYFRQGAVTLLTRRDDTLEAEVEGSDIEPYFARIAVEDGEIEGECSCPYEWGGWCKHLVAAGLAFLDDPDSVETGASPDALLDSLEPDELRALLRALVARNPRLMTDIEAQIELIRTRPKAATAESAPAAFAPVDPRPIQRQVRSALHSLDRMRRSDAYGQVGGVVEEVSRIAQEAQTRLEAGDGRGAIAILEAITEEYADALELLDDSDGEVSDFYNELGALWTEAILTAELSPPERKTLAKKLASWQREVEDYGVDEGFHAAIEAAKQGWDDPALLRVLQGEITEKGAWEGESPWYADDLAAARLNVLERQGRFQEALYLAEAEGQDARYTALLVQLGRLPEAVEYGLNVFGLTEEAFELAQILHDRQKTPDALRLAEKGLELQGPKNALALWLRDLAHQEGQADLAIRAGIAALNEAPTLRDYERLQQVAGPRAPEAREAALKTLEKYTHYVPGGAIDILLHEGRIDAAIAAVENGYDARQIERVAAAALTARPEWVIAACRKQAESIMDGGKASHYGEAAQWLKKAKAAYLTLNRPSEWQAYLDGLLTKHKAKYKLVPLLKNL